MDIFKTVTLKNTHQHPNIWICAWGLDTFCTYSYSHAWCNLILHLCCCRDTSLHPPTGSYTAVQDQPVGISGSHNLNSLYHLSVRTLSCNPDWQRYSWHKGTVFQRKCMKSYRWWQGRVRVSCHRGASFHKPLSRAGEATFTNPGYSIKNIFLFIFHNAPAVHAHTAWGWLEEPENISIKAQNRSKPLQIPNLFSTGDRIAA